MKLLYCKCTPGTEDKISWIKEKGDGFNDTIYDCRTMIEERR